MSTRSSPRTRALIEASDLEVRLPDLARAGSWGALVGDGQDPPLHLEIGIGKDPHVVERASREPETLFIGLEHSKKKLDAVHGKAIRRGVRNLRLLRADVFRVLDAVIPDGSLIGATMLFPDPWPKKRHAKKRMIQTPLIDALARKLQTGRRFELRTDHPNYAQQMLRVLDAHPAFVNLHGAGRLLDSPADPKNHVATLFEQKYRERGLVMHYLDYERTDHTVERNGPAAPFEALSELDALHGSEDEEIERRFGVIVQSSADADDDESSWEYSPKV